MYGKKIRNNNSSKKETSRHWRISVLVLFIFAGALAIIIRLYSIQVGAHQSYLDIAENQHQVMKELIPKRGMIYLGENSGLYPAAVNRNLPMLYLVPREVEDVPKVIGELSTILQMDKSAIENKLKNREDLFEIVKHKVSPDEENRIAALGLKGVKFMEESFRYYPSGELASQVLGFVGSDGNSVSGRYGVEKYWNETLEGISGRLEQERDAGGRWISISDRLLVPAQDGKNIVLSINRTVQYEVEKILKETVEQYQADQGSIIAMIPQTGKVIALANTPSFDANSYSNVEDVGVFMNPAVSSTYECGSVFKTFTAAVGINEGKIEPDSTYVDTGSVVEAGYEITNSDSKSYGKQTMTQVLEKSLNTGAVHIERLVGNQKFAEYMKRFGFGEKTGITLPGEIQGNTRNLDEIRRDIQFYTASFGQGIAVTPIQLISAYAAIANKGMLMEPQIVEKVISSNGIEEEVRPKEVRKVISDDAARKIGLMLRSVVVNGHGKRADVPGYLVGGKTGTAQVAKSDSKGYEEGLTIGSFAGYAPVDDPQFVVLVKIDNPKGVQWAESTAAPTFGKVMKFLLEYYKIMPTE
jgi:stage V sporulation protein D (sporulation-specific penicillin-binding protein)